MKDLTSWIAILFAACCVIAYVVIQIGYDAGDLVRGSAEEAYEVRMLTVDLPPTAETVAVEQKLLNEMAAQEWELITVLPTPAEAGASQQVKFFYFRQADD
ncbi:hypothetical protein Mal4_55200 [Maioricimonas rarisocia]|uniref:DUF4177 domain-containing protein n=1 Tax=Maioricimonas rarisocia TaxID=2528026 RepID=A0A517ZF89_9PLAN|nr:hypothetical protein [Maioricimonas rarisocia]QDU41155.1 hypothetical protein Mal4_55200 [Maioricimonas rarisocia]